MRIHRIVITVDPDGSLKFEQLIGGSTQGPDSGRQALVRQADTIDWYCEVGNYACLFKSDSPLNVKAVSGAAFSNAPTPPVPVTRAHNQQGNNEYKYLVVVFKDDGTVLSQDPTIIIDRP